MSRKMALLISTALTVFVLVIVSALVMRVSVGGLVAQAASPAVQNPDATGLAVPAPQTDPALDALAQHDQSALQRLNQANAQIQQENDELRALQNEYKKLQALNAAMAAREKIYQQRLAAANNTIAQITAAPATDGSGGGGGNAGPAVNAPSGNSGGGSPNQGAPAGNNNSSPKPSGGNPTGHPEDGHDHEHDDGGHD